MQIYTFVKWPRKQRNWCGNLVSLCVRIGLKSWFCPLVRTMADIVFPKSSDVNFLVSIVVYFVWLAPMQTLIIFLRVSYGPVSFLDDIYISLESLKRFFVCVYSLSISYCKMNMSAIHSFLVVIWVKIKEREECSQIEMELWNKSREPGDWE